MHEILVGRAGAAPARLLLPDTTHGRCTSTTVCPRVPRVTVLASLTRATGGRIPELLRYQTLRGPHSNQNNTLTASSRRDGLYARHTRGTSIDRELRVTR